MCLYNVYNMSGIIKPFIVINPGNTCYISSLLTAMFYHPSIIGNVLTRDAEDDDTGSVMMLQEMIKHQYVDAIQSNTSVMGDTMSTIRGMLVQAGWLGYLPDDLRIEQMFAQHDVNELYHFLMQKMRGPTIDINIKTIYPDGIQKDSMVSLPFISLSIPPLEKDGMVQVKDLLGDYMTEQKKKLHHEGEEAEVTDICTINNIPEFIALAVNRFSNMTERNHALIDINTRILPFKTLDASDIQNVAYHLHAIVCLRSETVFAGHYYAILYNQDTKIWYKFDDLVEPCLSEINIKDPEVIHDISSNVTFLLYRSSLA
jgi:uncharacterized UBP type Zn finger protein